MSKLSLSRNDRWIAFKAKLIIHFLLKKCNKRKNLLSPIIKCHHNLRVHNTDWLKINVECERVRGWYKWEASCHTVNNTLMTRGRGKIMERADADCKNRNTPFCLPLLSLSSQYLQVQNKNGTSCQLLVSAFQTLLGNCLWCLLLLVRNHY